MIPHPGWVESTPAAGENEHARAARATTVWAVNSHQQRYIAEELGAYRERLEAARNDLDPSLDEEGQPAHPIGRRMVEVEGRMLEIEHYLVDDLKAVKRRERLHPIRRIKELTRPRLGILRHHPPVPLLVPTRYVTTEAPSPAPTISIVTPSFEQGHYLERTLYSVVNQNYPALEYVVQDGESTDDTIDVLRRYESSLSHWASESDEGQGDAINRGFAHTSGEIMAYLNSDDLLLPGSLAYVARYFASHPDVDVIYGNRMMIDENDGHIGSQVLPRHDDHELTLLDFVPQETLFWRRSAWDAAGGKIDAGLRFAIDWDLLLRLRESGAKMVRVPRFLGAFRVHDEQKTATWWDHCLVECDQLRRRVHGRAISHDEAVARAMPYMRRHVPHHLWYRLKMRLPLPRQPVRTLPLEPWFRASPDGERRVTAGQASTGS
jgi:glycosyltransferase involved in cell wall biosynthesis